MLCNSAHVRNVVTFMRSYALLPAILLMCGTGFAQAPDTVIRSSVREVLLDVVVRDAHGRLITNLKPGEIAVYEDGVRQDVRSFRLVAGSEVRVEDAKQAAEAQAPWTRAAKSNSARPSFNPLRTVNVVCLILNDLNPETRGFAFESARKFVNEELRPNTFIGVFSLDASGLRPVFPFSNNREHLLKAVELAAVNQLPSVSLGSAALLSGLSMQTTGSIVPPGSGTENADGSSPADPLGTRGDMGFSVNAGLREIDALIGLVRQLSPLPFQKTALLLSTGLTRPPDQLEYWDSLIRQATKAGVTFYAMDVWGLGVCQDAPSGSCLAPQSASAPSVAMMNYVSALSQQQGPASIGQSAGSSSSNATHGPPAVSPAAVMMELAHEDDYVKFTVSSANRQEAIRELAERTGGFLIANTNNTDKLLTHVMEEVDTHYEVAYPPKSEREDGHFRKIEVKLARAGLRVETRSGYFAVPDTAENPVTPEEMAGLKALDTQPRPHAFDFLSRAYRFRDAGGTAQYAIAFEMPISNLTAAPGPMAKTHALHASLLALVKDAQGQIVDRVSKDVPSVVPDDRLAAVRVELMTYQHAVNLPPGHYTVETAVVDHEGNQASTGIVEIDNRAQRGVGLSDLALVRRLDHLGPPPDPADPFEYTGKRVLPFVTTNLFAGALPFVYMVIYPEPGNPANPTLRVRLLKNGRLLTTINPALPSPDDSGDIPMVIQPTGKPGSYEVKATVVQGASSMERSLAYTVAAK
jgi:VWFA-related protein